MALQRLNVGSSLSAQAASVGADIPLGAASKAALLGRFPLAREVPGYPGAFVARGPVGEQLFVDGRLLARPDRAAILRSVWRAAFGKPLAPGYQAVPTADPGPKVSYLVVIAIIAILISLMLPDDLHFILPGTGAGPIFTAAVGAGTLGRADVHFH